MSKNTTLSASTPEPAAVIAEAHAQYETRLAEYEAALASFGLTAEQLTDLADEQSALRMWGRRLGLGTRC